MPKMIALKKFHYPSGPTGKDHQPGDDVDVKTDRDAKALRLLKVAQDAPPVEAVAPKPSGGKKKKEAEGSYESKPIEAISTTSMGVAHDESATTPRARTYKREDMTAEEKK
jgi:hypothetical protein